MPNKIKEIRQICIKANQDILKLEFGCLLHRKNKDKDYGYYQVLEQGSGFHPDFLWVSSRVYGRMLIRGDEIGSEQELSEKDIRDKFEIIGKPIRLADILYAVKKIGYNSTEEWFKVLGRFIDLYNLLADNIELQSEETVSFIHEVLTKK